MGGGYAYIGDFGYMVILNVFNSWDGSASNDWNNSSNWDYGVVPSSNDYAIAPSGSTIVIVTHDDEIAKLCSRIMRIEDGSVVLEEE